MKFAVQPPALRPLFTFSLALAVALSLPGMGAEIPAWRANQNGVYETDAAPLDWKSKLLFEVPLESKSNGTPILVDDKLIFTAEPAWLICADSKTGEVLWRRSNDLMELNNLSEQKREALTAHKARIASIEQEVRRLRNDTRRLQRALDNDEGNTTAEASLREKTRQMDALNEEIDTLRADKEFSQFVTPPAHNTNGYSSYTPVFDGKRIYATFGLGVVVAYDLNGNRIWSRFLEHPDHRWGGATMPQIVDGKLIVRFDHYAALNPANGEILWTAPSEVVFGTPAPFSVEGQHYLFTPRGEVIRASDGKVIQKGLVFLHATRDWSIFNTPTVVDDVIYTVSGVEKANGDAYAYRIPRSVKKLEASGLEQVWHTKVEKDRYYSSVLIHDGIKYIVTRDNLVTALDASNGKIIYTHQIKGAKGTAYPSMVLAGGKIYVGIDDGHLVVMQPGRRFKELARHQVGPYRSTPIFSDSMAFLRTYESLQAVSSL